MSGYRFPFNDSIALVMASRNTRLLAWSCLKCLRNLDFVQSDCCEQLLLTLVWRSCVSLTVVSVPSSRSIMLKEAGGGEGKKRRQLRREKYRQDSYLIVNFGGLKGSPQLCKFREAT